MGKRVCLGMALLAGVVVALTAAEPVVQLREVLRKHQVSPEERAASLLERTQALGGVADLFQALMLQDWRTHDVEPSIAEVDRAAQTRVARRFADQVRLTLRRNDDDGRLAVLGMLAEMGDRQETRVARECAVDLAQLMTQGSLRVREEAARVLGRIQPDPRVACPAWHALRDAPEASLRLACVQGVSALMSRACAVAARTRSLGDQNACAAELSAVAQGALPLTGHACADAHVLVRRLAVGTIREGVRLVNHLLACQTATPAPCPQTAQTPLTPLLLALHAQRLPLVGALRDDDTEVRLLARLALEELAELQRRFPPGRPVIQQARFETPADMESWRASLPELMAALGDADVRARLKAIDILETLGPAAAPAAPALIHALRDSDHFVRWAAARALGPLAPADAPRAVPRLASLLLDPDLDVRLAAARTLERYGPEAQAAFPRLCRALHQDNPELRLAVLRVVAVLGSQARPAVPDLRDLLQDQDSRVRLRAAAVLARLGPAAHAAADALRLALHDSDPDVRAEAAKALLHITGHTD